MNNSVEARLQEQREAIETNRAVEFTANRLGKLTTNALSLEVPDGIIDTFTFPALATVIAGTESVTVSGDVKYPIAQYVLTESPASIKFTPGNLPTPGQFVYMSGISAYVYTS